MPVFAGLTPGRLLAMLRDPSSPLNVRWSRLLGLSPWFLRMLANANEGRVRAITRALANLCQNGERTYAALWQAAGMGDLVRAHGSLALSLSEEDRDRDWDGPLALLRSMGVPMERSGPAELKRQLPGGPERGLFVREDADAAVRDVRPGAGPRVTAGDGRPDPGGRHRAGAGDDLRAVRTTRGVPREHPERRGLGHPAVLAA